MRFLGKSCADYDAGDESEAKRLATTLRILLHDHGRSSHSLLGQLGVKERLRWFDTAKRINPNNLAPTNGLVIVQVKGTGSKSEVRYVPPLGERFSATNRPARFSDWWTMEIVKDGLGQLFSRKKIVMAVANKDGGAHIDPKLSDDYAALSRSNSLGVTAIQEGEGVGMSLGGPGEPALNNAALAAVRQIAFEVEQTLGKQFRWLVEEDESDHFDGVRRRIDRAASCLCGRARSAGECCLSDSERAFVLGNDLTSRGELDFAIDALTVSADLEHRLAPFNLGLALAATGDFEAAEVAFRLGAELGDGGAASNLGRLLDEGGDRPAAIEAYKRGIDLGFGGAAYNLGTIRYSDGDRAEAKALWIMGAALGDENAAFMAGNLARQDGENGEALRLFGEARVAGHGQAAYNHGIALRETGALKSARAAFHDAARSGDEEAAARAKMELDAE